MNPKHQNPTKADRVACAPYNFVPLPEKVVTVDPAEIPDQDAYTGYTGHIDCVLETRSPLYTRCALDPEFFARWTDNVREMMRDDGAREQYAQFFYLEDAERPVIPGSSLRGMVRALVEIVGYGKMQWVTGESLVFRAVGDTTSLGNYYRKRLVREDKDKHFIPLVLAGYMENHKDRWFIRPAQTIEGTTFARINRSKIPSETLVKWRDCKNAYRLWVKLGSYDYQPVRGGFLYLKYMPVLEANSEPTPGFREVVLVCSGNIKTKKREFVVFPPDESADLIEISDDLLRAYGAQMTQAQQQLLGPQGVLNPGQPVFYLVEDGKLVFFGHTMMFRLPYQRSPLDLVPEQLRRTDSVDLAEAIFGFAPQEKSDHFRTRAGRVFFTSAWFESDKAGIWLSGESITPKILSSPKPTAFQHYLTQQEPDEVDSGKRDKKGNPKMELRLDHYASPPPHRTVIRGHKIYWHRGLVNREEIQENNPVDWATDTQHICIRPVKPGVRFRFQIYFENLRNYELGALLWALILPGEPGRDYCHSLGMGKPLGMGAVKITPTLYLSDRASRYSKLFEEDDWYRGERPCSDLQHFIQAFEQFVLDRMDERERGRAQSLREVERIRMLLRMLEWPGPDPNSTRYMTLDEFKKRPVLPDPLHIKPCGMGIPSSKPEKTTSRGPSGR